MVRDYQGIAMELALVAAGHKFPRLSEVGAAWASDTGGPSQVDVTPPVESPVHRDAATDGLAFFLLDITICDDGSIRLIEANGSNAALSSSVLGKDDKRAEHMYLSYASKKKPAGQVAVILAYSPSLLHMGEFFGRAAIFAERVSHRKITRLCNTTENLGTEEVSIICGSIPDLSDHIRLNKNGYLTYKDRPVIFACNPNLLPELCRRDIIKSVNEWYNVRTYFYHEGPCTPLIHDKGFQQDIANDTGIIPIQYEKAYSSDECLEIIHKMNRRDVVSVGKMNAGSGGAGIAFFPPGISEADRQQRLDELFESARQKYGKRFERTVYPVRFFEFVKSTLYNLHGHGHIWDMRFQCLVYPGYVEVTPCVMRLCSKPFDGTNYDRETVVSNLTGRDPDTLTRFMRSPAARRRSEPVTVYEAVGITPEKKAEIIDACARWCEAAWISYTQGG